MKTNGEQQSNIGAFVLLFIIFGLTGATLLGSNPVQTLIDQYTLFIWGPVFLFFILGLRHNSEQLGLLLLIQGITIMTGIGLSLKDFNNVPFGIFGGLVWAAVLIATFVFGLLYFAQFVLPLKGNEGWSEGLRLLGRHFFDPPAPKNNIQYNNSKSGKGKTKPSKKDQGHLPASFSKLKAGSLKSYEVLALTKGSGFARPVGPGFVMLFKNERIAGLIDLRKHVRSQSVKANSRDGIPIETHISVTFRVKHLETNNVADDLQHPYDKEAIFSICYANSIDAENELLSWKERLCPQAAALLISELSQYTLNELFRADEAGLGILDDIKDRIKQQLGQQLEKDGIEILAIGLGQLVPPDRVNQQRIKTWQADWKRKIKMQQASGNAEALRRIKKARARAQIEIIETITQNVHAMHQSGDSNLTDIIFLRLIEALEKAVSNESVKMMIPQEVMTQLIMDSSTKLHQLTSRASEGT